MHCIVWPSLWAHRVPTVTHKSSSPATKFVKIFKVLLDCCLFYCVPTFFYLNFAGFSQPRNCLFHPSMPRTNKQWDDQSMPLKQLLDTISLWICYWNLSFWHSFIFDLRQVKQENNSHSASPPQLQRTEFCQNFQVCWSFRIWPLLSWQCLWNLCLMSKAMLETRKTAKQQQWT